MARRGLKEIGCSLVSDGTFTLKSSDLHPGYTCLVVSGDMLMVTDDIAWNVQLYKIHDKTLLATTDKLESEPCGICLINENKICVTLEKSIEVMSVQCTGDTYTITRDRTLHVNKNSDWCHGVVLFKDKVVVSGWKDHTIFWCIVSLDDGHMGTFHPICKGTKSSLTAKDNIIYISCDAGRDSPDNGVYGYDIQNPNKDPFIYKNKELKDPTGITVDNKGFIFVCNWIPPCIHHLTDKCELVTIYREGMPWNLWAIFWDQDCLFVTCYGSNKITRYKPDYSGDSHPGYAGLVVSGDKFMVIDDIARTVQLYRLHDNILLATTVKLQAEPRGICLFNENKICVTLEKSIEIMSVQYTGDTGTIQCVRTLNLETKFDWCHGVVIVMDKVVVSGWKDRTIFWCTVSLNDGNVDTVHPICNGARSYLTAKDSMIYISCDAGRDSPDNGVYGYDIQNPNNDPFIYKNKELNDPTGVTVDDKSFIFVCNWIPPCIHHLTDKCEPVTIYREGMPWNLWAIFWDQDCLFLTCYGSNKITGYSPDYSDHKLRDVQARDERKQPVIGETSTLIGQGTDKGLACEQVQRFSEDDEQGGYGAPEFKLIYERKEPVVKETARDIGYRSESEEQVGKSTEMKHYPVCTQRITSPTCPKDLTHLSKQLSETLMETEKNAKFIVWPGTNLANNMAVFVCLYHGVMQKTKQKYEGIDIYYKDSETPSRPLEPPHKIPIDSEFILCYKDAELLQQAIEEHGHDLFKQHSNIEAITGSSFILSYSKGCIKCPSVVLYCRVKGIAPIGEAAFPTMLTIAEKSIRINVDVREGYLRQGMYRASTFCKTDWHDRLRMGISIGVRCGSQGTLGPFVKINDKDIGFLTCAHVILPDPMDQRALKESEGCEVFQPADGESHPDFEKNRDERYCGVVSKIVFNPQISDPMNGLSKTVGVDAALVTVRGNRVEDVRSFPFIADKDLRNAGFEPTHPPMFGHGLVLKYPLDFKKCQGKRVIKYGRTSGLTLGRMSMNGAMIKVDDAILQLGTTKEHVTMKGQYIIERVGKPIFFESGDSGSAVFMADAKNKLTCIGLAIGDLDDFQTVVTPIEYVLTALGLPLDSMDFEENMDVQ